jgi:predicted HNH restriction endonuclease
VGNRYQVDSDYSKYKYHVAECATLQTMRENNRFGRYVLTGRVDGKFVVNQFIQGEDEPYRKDHEIRMDVCKNCLKALNWDSYISLPGIRRDQAVKDFNPEKYLKKYGSKVRTFPMHDERSARMNQYPSDWDEISRKVRRHRNWTCEECGVNLGEHSNGDLHVHHKDGQKHNCAWSNLKVVCIDCHKKEFNHQHLSNGRRSR